jgi:hypothetical protein
MHLKPVPGVALTLLFPSSPSRALHSKTDAFGVAVFKKVRLSPKWKLKILAKKAGWRDLAVAVPAGP